MIKVFISHRREDAPYAARSIKDALSGQFGTENVYFDLDSLLAGLDWRKQIDEMVAACDVMLVVIGDRWHQRNKAGRSRLENEDDLVRFEVSSALRRVIPVIPVLVGKATIPKLEDLPDDVKDLPYRQAVEVRATSDFTHQIERLLECIDAVTPQGVDPWDTPPPEETNVWDTPPSEETNVWDTPPSEETNVWDTPPPEETKIDDVATKPVVTEVATDQPKARPAKPASKARRAGQVFRDGDDCPEMVVIPAGSFVMGGSEKDEQPQHRVTVSKFALGKYPVTFGEYDAFAHSTGRDLPEDNGWGRGGRPVINVSWEDAQVYIDWLKLHTGKPYRLPSEAEWEYAARAGTNTGYWWGNDLNQDGKVWANCAESNSDWSGRRTSPVGKFRPNPFGLHDMAGNVWEWIEDCWHNNYENAPQDGSVWLLADGGDYNRRVIRGGSWNNKAGYLRSAFRGRFEKEYPGFARGFRVAQDLPD